MTIDFFARNRTSVTRRQGPGASTTSSRWVTTTTTALPDDARHRRRLHAPTQNQLDYLVGQQVGGTLVKSYSAKSSPGCFISQGDKRNSHIHFPKKYLLQQQIECKCRWKANSGGA
eukprot:TRINITY_DN23318_c0_g1_i1.p1 TRINITY_DN23318_c0_g1~~TRINITY_DN23318_c0_g1_i1.p1  ORF type:complete len:116 (-),score=3.59 TRINITY_DN23318_c0_g1_i1:11-358(-)